MAFCGKCGTKLVDDALYCHMCGSMSVNHPEKQGKSNESDTQKCPDCGAIIGRLDVACRFCGRQIVARNTANSLKEFAEGLSRIDSEAPAQVKVYNTMTGPVAVDSFKRGESIWGSKVLDKKISFIMSYPIPNTIEEIVEFVLLTISNIDVQYGNKKYDNPKYSKPGYEDYSSVILSQTWIKKLEQAYIKAQVLFPDEPVFNRLKNIYESKMRALDRL